MKSVKFLHLVLLVLLVATIQACSEGGVSNPDPDPSPDPGETLAPSISSFTATPDTVSAGGSATLAWQVSGTGPTLKLSGIGTVTGESRSVSPTATTTYTLKAENAAGEATKDVTVTVLTDEPGNQAPVAYDQSVSTEENSALSITLTGLDVDADDTLSFSVTSQPIYGSLSGTEPNLTYTPNSGYTGGDSFKFKVSDSVLESSEATISITVTEKDGGGGTPTECPEDDFLSVSQHPKNTAYTAPSLSVSCSSSDLIVKTNNIPDFEYVQVNPETLTAQDYTFTIPLNPAKRSAPGAMGLGEMGVSVTGLALYAAFESPKDGYGDPIADDLLDWCNGHPGFGGAYHHHGRPDCIFTERSTSTEQVGLVYGYIFDGYPIVSPYECADEACSSLTEVKSSYVKTGSGNAAFEDYTYQAGSGDLDECNGRVGADGQYRYYATNNFPYLPFCFYGETNYAQGDFTGDAPSDGGGDGGGGNGPPPPPGDGEPPPPPGDGGGGSGGDNATCIDAHFLTGADSETFSHGLTRVLSVSCSDSSATLSTNAVPNHDAQSLRSSVTVTAQTDTSFNVSLTPTLTGSLYDLEYGAMALAISGVKFSPGAKIYYNNDASSGWEYDALESHANGAKTLHFDEHNAHVQSNDGEYHYHGPPKGLVESLITSDDDCGSNYDDMLLVGYMGDGFPLYHKCGYKVVSDSSSGLEKLSPSYQIKTGTRPSGPGGTYDGTFLEDYDYSTSYGDLDECNGRSGPTPEYPEGIYHYYLTDSFPFVPRCFKGTPDDSFIPRALGGTASP